MSTAMEVAQSEQKLLEAARRAAPPQEYRQLDNKWQDANKPHLTGVKEAMVDHAVEIESFVVAGNIREARQTHYEMTRYAVEQLSPMQRKRFWDECRP